jgi:hypothetical protein
LPTAPDDVHKILITKKVLKPHHASEGWGWDFGN